ncbi:tetrahydrofolylpolyglutamate synthase [Grosmannia clavigera kw1407]|uniref:tetrahydrofolate synthase n=1 Tax=Grosmannia clavigera (strain kw1407 / UAMH 11150) TaxID=655863 RepID=F0XU28_GROCL|nr:tetrahydrofolylpolyglutamate synthase [Grosmannia clavigera kw1407]EFW98403.1 tetrahydrofolylpolyglutamate synthase [Grosmannia clavigera kw1407]
MRRSWAGICSLRTTAKGSRQSVFMSTSATAVAPLGSRDSFAALPRTYANALGLLGQLSTNRDVTALFEVAGAETKAGGDLNAPAMPEVRAWLGRAGYANPTRDLAQLRCVHVAGTKGKGSVCALVTAILVAEAGRQRGVGRVGTYLSPHVVSVRERIWLDGRPISQALFARYVFEVWERLSEAAAAVGSAASVASTAATPAGTRPPPPYGPATKPFYFRFLTLVALHAFVREGVRSAVIECGIGGEYDVTNVLPPAVVTAAAVSRLGIDHVAMLGRALGPIAWHKAGIFKPGVAAFMLQGDDEESRAAMAVLRARAREKGVSALYEITPDCVDRWDGLPDAALHGSFQKHNMALAAALACHHLQQVRGPETEAVSPSASSPPPSTLLDPASMPPRFRQAMAAATLRARCESVHDADVQADWLVDGAHTTDSLAEVARFFVSAEPEPGTTPILLFSVRDRNPAELVRALLAATPDRFFRHALLVFPPSQNDEAARAAALQAITVASPGTAASAWDDVPAAVARIRALAGASARCRILATGSFVLAREVLQELHVDGEE